jgi:outer membrane murein-binding lipoprotein Lpp
MSVKVNLLPQEVAAERAARRTTGLTIAAVLLLVVVLAGVHLLRLGEIGQAEEERDATQAEISRLQAEVAQLEQFRQLADELEARNAVLAAAMGSEISFARMLNDLSLAFPAGSSLRSLTATVLTPEAVSPTGEVAFGEAVASVAYEGYSVERYAPGVEAVLIEFDKVRSFFSAFVESAQLEEIGTTEVTSFSGSIQVDEDALTGRYADGLPEEVTP